MIPFNVFGHTKRAGAVDEIPIVWVDAQDTGSYTLSGNDVTALFNKGTLGGAMTLNGTVKFANSGFESWSTSDYITRDLGEPFLTTNSFTMVTTFDFQDYNNGLFNWFSGVFAEANNRSECFRNNVFQSSLKHNGVQVTTGNETNATGLRTMMTSYNVDTQEVIFLKTNGSGLNATGVVFNNILNSSIFLLIDGTLTGANTGANNPLHEFRLYNRAFDLTEMQTLQTELNNKYIQLGSELVTNGDFATNSDWTLLGGWSISGGSANSAGGSIMFQNVGIQPNKNYRIKYTISNYVSGSFRVRINGSPDANGIIRNSDGSYEEDLVSSSGANGNFSLTDLSTNFVGSIDNVSVKEIL